MIVVEIQSEEDGRISFEVGPFATTDDAARWREWFVGQVPVDPAFVEVREIERRLYNPGSTSDVAEVLAFYGGTL